VLLGRVEGLQQRTLRLPMGVSGAMQLVARPMTNTEGRRHASEPFTLSPGQRLTWRLRQSPGAPSVPNLSTIQVFTCDEGSC
jgi:hypothetical protein